MDQVDRKTSKYTVWKVVKRIFLFIYCLIAIMRLIYVMFIANEIISIIFYYGFVVKWVILSHWFVVTLGEVVIIINIMNVFGSKQVSIGRTFHIINVTAIVANLYVDLADIESFMVSFVVYVIPYLYIAVNAESFRQTREARQIG